MPDLEIAPTPDVAGADGVEGVDDDILAMFENVRDDETAPPRLKEKPRRCETREFREASYQEKHRETRRARRQAKAQEKKSERFEMLSAMTPEDRRQFLSDERKAKETNAAEEEVFLDKAFASGRPRIAFNCSFNEHMGEKEISSLAKQIRLAYHEMKGRRQPMQFHITSMNEELKARNERYCMQSMKVHIHEQPYWELFDHKDIVVMSPDADEDLEEVSEDKVYIIGGLIDRGVIAKNISRSQALANGGGSIQIRKLPIKKYHDMKMCSVLNCNTVVALLAQVLEHGDWKRAFEAELPTRKAGECGRQGRRKKAHEERSAGQASPSGDGDLMDAEEE